MYHFLSEGMSIVKRLEEDGVWVIDHQDLVRKSYSDVGLKSINIFDIKSQFLMDAQAEKIANEMEGEASNSKRKKRKLVDEVKQSVESEFVRKKFEKIRDSIREFFDPPPSSDVVRENNRNVRKIVSELQTSNFPIRHFSGENSSNMCQTIKIGETEYVIPPKSRYCVDDLINFDSAFLEQKFDLILMDPPWENKHVKRVNKRDRKDDRKSGYDLLSTDSMSTLLSNVVIQSLTPKSGLVLIWCTNSEKQQKAILDWAKHWKLELKAKWFWLKVSKFFAEKIVLFRFQEL